jgi:peptide/nickel transport system ATP-binding protein
MSLLEITDLSVDYRVTSGVLRAVDHVSLSVEAGEAVGLVGESGCGKTSLGLTVPLLLPPNATVATGRVVLDGEDVTHFSERAMNRLRWTKVAFVFQGAMNALNPVQRVDRQIVDAIAAHEPKVSSEAARERALSLLDLVGVSPSRAKSYPHEFSGGMRQRVMIAMSLACSPSLLIADEPTTALDVISQEQILTLLSSLRRERALGLIMISHDLAAIRRVCDRIIVMYAGVVVEYGSTQEVLAHRGETMRVNHPYTKALINAHPDLRGPRALPEGLSGHPPDLSTTLVGCRFADRCPDVMDICRRVAPPAVALSAGHVASCHLLSGER